MEVKVVHLKPSRFIPEESAPIPTEKEARWIPNLSIDAAEENRLFLPEIENTFLGRGTVTVPTELSLL
jgi:hypothetical protein